MLGSDFAPASSAEADLNLARAVGGRVTQTEQNRESSVSSFHYGNGGTKFQKIGDLCSERWAASLIVQNHLRRRSATADSSCGEFARFKSATGLTRCGELCAHFLDLRRLLFQLCRLLVKHIRGKRESPLQFQAPFFDCLRRSDSILSQ